METMWAPWRSEYISGNAAQDKPKADVCVFCDALKTTITEISYDGLTGTGQTWDASGAVSKDPKAVVIENGVYVSAE